ncbi:hypothetical protein OPKNFCMD_1763 [Methylobacterium crusticola]|uniref:Uncharacterized protein n=1 Tax=Methylobacterium crusticola TaxID=1697972 RepID=A0ABQ4QUL9_9HYPH|nr:hypothetical protein [Methylobacterium crusticola]GJD49035.1 hypothetical protein OPKNFCMD_1763 [Methylobacterium crusticola]
MNDIRGVRTFLLAAAVLGAGMLGSAGARAESDVPPYMSVIVGAKVPDRAATARQNVLALNSGMFELYGEAGKLVQGSILAQHPVILGLFSGAGGRFILYRPGKPALEGPPVPEVYQLLKSVGHSVMALGVVVGPHLGKPEDTSWQPSLASYRVRLKAALDSLDATSMPAEWRANNQALVAENIAFIDQALADGVVTFAAVQSFAARQKDRLKLNIQWAADTQVKHWMAVLADWKQQLGPEWSRAYAASNTIYVARQNNVLFSVLAQFFAPEEINSRLMLIETVSFTTTPTDMLESLTRIISDRTVGETFFGNAYLMDYELMGGDARDTIARETKARGMPTHLPPRVPFGSHQWPTLITAGTGPATLADLP